jgi:hypothetical protein
MTLDENDFVTYQLYTASKTPRIKNARIRGWIVTTLAFFVLAYLFFDSGNDPLAIYFLLLSGLSLALYPFYSRWKYKRHCVKYIRDTYKNRFGAECAFQINEDIIFTKDNMGEAKINTTKIEELNEIADFYFIEFKTGVSLIIPKRKIDNAEEMKNKLSSLVDQKGIKHNIELDWKWR